MASFAEGLVLEAAFSDFDALAQATAGWSLTFSQAASGAFSGSILMAATPALQIVKQNWSTPLIVEGQQPDDMASIALAIPADGPVRWLGTEIDPRLSVFGGSRGHEVRFRTFGEVQVLAVSVSRALLDRHVETRFASDGQAIGQDILWRIPPGAAEAGDRAIALDALRAVLARGPAVTPAARQHLEEAAMQILLDGLPIGAPPAMVSASQRRQVVRAAEEALRARLDDPPSLSELCRLTGVGERTLQLAFQDIHAVSPKRYLRVLRLNAARRKLRRCEGSVTEVALEFGFFHFARFATEYRQLFHQLSSETLRLARQEHGLR